MPSNPGGLSEHERNIDLEHIGSNDPTYSAARLPDGERAALKAAWMAARARDPRGPEVIGGVAFRAGWFAARRYHGERDV